MKRATLSVEGVSVMIGMPVNRDIPVMTVKSLLQTHDLCVRRNIPIAMGFVVGSAIITKARDEVVDLFLKSNATHLFWIDSDIVWTPEDFIRLLALSEKVDVVGGSYPAKIDDCPTFFIKYDQDKGLRQDEYGLIEIDGIGLGFMVMKRKVIEDVSMDSPVIYDEIAEANIRSIFRVSAYQGKFRSEDMAFLSDIKDIGYKVWLDPEINLGHIGQKQYTGSIKEAFNLTGEITNGRTHQNTETTKAN